MLSKHLKSPDGSVFSGAGVSVHPPGIALAKMQRNAQFHSFSKIHSFEDTLLFKSLGLVNSRLRMYFNKKSVIKLYCEILQFKTSFSIFINIF